MRRSDNDMVKLWVEMVSGTLKLKARQGIQAQGNSRGLLHSGYASSAGLARRDLAATSRSPRFVRRPGSAQTFLPRLEEGRPGRGGSSRLSGCQVSCYLWTGASSTSQLSSTQAPRQWAAWPRRASPRFSLFGRLKVEDGHESNLPSCLRDEYFSQCDGRDKFARGHDDHDAKRKRKDSPDSRRTG